jgi:hypothetical protein
VVESQLVYHSVNSLFPNEAQPPTAKYSFS